MTQPRAEARVQAVLGPTNTGKTHYALERMMGYASGMIGFPLRLLARENYERVVRVKGADQVALVTGEEKLIPAHPRYFLCTTESMPLDRRVDFLAVDEIQMCADLERGHIFTDRLLHARGQSETLFLGAEAIRPLIQRLIPGIEFVTRPRLSQLTYVGPRKLARLPPKSAVVAFSAAEVYAMAEYVRRGRGGAAVVLGALSPRTRNAQVAMYQAGEVDYIVATDAIGMGLNMNVDHVAFASLRKFDGQGPRALFDAEVAQIAGRAGRHMNDGTFGTTADQPGIAPETVAAVEAHRFPALKALAWRNTDLRFTSVAALLASLDKMPDRAGLLRVTDADDQLALGILAKDDGVAAKAISVERVRLLWDVCQIPDFRKVLAENHTRLLGAIYGHLTGPGERLPTDYMAAQVGRLDRTDGDIDTLMGRIAAVRTWTYVSHRADWVADPGHWQGLTRVLEDKLSDALHERLTQRFVDRRTAVLVRRLRDPAAIVGSVAADGAVSVEGQTIGRLTGFIFQAGEAGDANAAKAVLAAAVRALGPEIAARTDLLAGAGDDAFTLNDDGLVLWRGEAVARLSAGASRIAPQIKVLPSDLLEPVQRDRIRARAVSWVRAFITDQFGVLADASPVAATGAVRGLLHSLSQSLGAVERALVEPQVRALTDSDRATLRRLGLRVGRRHVFVKDLFKPRLMRLRRVLCIAFNGFGPIEPAPRAFRLSAPGSADDYLALGYALVGVLAVKVDTLDKVITTLQSLGDGPEAFTPPAALVQVLDLDADAVPLLLGALGYRVQADGRFLAPKVSRAKSRGAQPKPQGGDSPFAVLLKTIPV